MKQVAAIDVGGTTIKGALMDADGRLSERMRVPTEADAGVEQVIANIRAVVSQLTADGRAVAVGLGVPGIVDERNGLAVASTNLRWQNLPLRALLAEQTGLPVLLGHDVRCGALAEGVFGAAQGLSDYLFVALGTGVGSGIVLGGQPYTGHAGLGGEFGHTVVDPAGPLCLCGKRGCLEAIASAGAVARRYAERVGLAEGSLSAAEVAARAERGEAVAGAILAEAAAALGLGLANYAVLLNPAAMLVGGGLAEAGQRFLQQTIQAFRQWTEPPLWATPILPAALGVDAGLVGAGLLALRR